MKTIEITDEQYKFLCEAQSLLKTQDNRCTSDPLYCIMKKERIYGFDPDFSSNYIWAREDEQFENDKELFDNIIEYFEKEIKEYTKEYYNVEGPIDDKKLEEGFLEDIEDYSIVYEEFLSSHDYYKVYYNYKHAIDENSNIWSLFEIDAEEYAKSKFGKDSETGYSYACSSWRSTRMNKVRDFLMSVKL